MDIRRIISEAIDRTVLANYSAQMKRYLGQYGLDPRPLGTNRTALNFLKEFNDFCFQVTFAIDDKHYKPSTGTRTRTTRVTPGNNNIENDKYVRRPGDNWATSLVNTTLDAADDTYHYFNGQINLDPIVGGMARSFGNGYNAGVQAFNPDLNNMNNQQQQTQKRTTTRTRRPKTGVDLTTLMGNQYYLKVMNDYRYTNQLSPGLVNRVRGLKEVLKILEDIKTALSA